MRRGGAVPDARFVACACQVLYAQNAGEIDEYLRQDGDRDAPPGGRHALVRGPPPPRHDSSDATLRRCRHLRRRRRAFQHSEEMRCSPSAQQRAVATREHGREIARLDARRSVSNPVDAAMLPQEGAGAQPVLDLRDREPRAQQLCSRHHAVLPSRDSREFLLHRPALRSHGDH
jgi:hypothetical protein